MKFKILFLATASLLFSCQNKEISKSEEVARKYFETYSAKTDYNQMKSFYNDSVDYENVIQNTSVIKFETGYLLNELFAWNDKSLAYENNKVLKVDGVIANDSMAVVNGQFNSYTYNGFTFAPMKFTTYLYFDKNHKIIKQVDWMNYPIGDLIELYQMEQSKSIDVDN
ncbi:hypothetical protein [Faecalibacter bovis]|uniref:Nuclear transport factor 2 family protein n=1 Tax=Faecalibacter bovis TaxID=2898187 RepID=A0ABX7XBN3_9FLAO|nr:hypothetical protein [Faecalibacter bovis]QTV05311.1 hypothetical protein J9309_11070 [Faecalibacter bovis]